MSELLEEQLKQHVEKFQKECRRENAMYAAFIAASLCLFSLGVYFLFSHMALLGASSFVAAAMAITGGRLIRGDLLRCPYCGESFSGKGRSYMSALCPGCGARLWRDRN